MNNPFIFGKVVYGDSFLNRESEISDITQSLLSGQNVICYSPRRYGKTSLLMRVKKNLETKGHLVFFIDLFRVTSLEDLYNIYTSSIANAIRSPIKALIETLQNILPSINPKVVFKSPESPTVEVSLPLPVLLKTETLHELFGSLEEYCKRKKKKGTVIFDEFQELTIIKDGPTIEREMRSAFQHHTYVSYAFLGSKQNLLKGIFRDKNRPFYNFGRHFELDVIDTAHWVKFIGKRMGSLCPQHLIDQIVHITENHPYFTQMYCHYLWEYCRNHNCIIDQPIMVNVLKEILERDGVLMSELWERTKITERHLLKAIAKDEPENIYEKNFLLKNTLGSASSVQKALEKLLDLDYIRKSKQGKFFFVNPFFKQWVLNFE
jgi:AAA+ ATPase superfamily predicted ATPase